MDAYAAIHLVVVHTLWHCPMLILMWAHKLKILSSADHEHEVDTEGP